MPKFNYTALDSQGKETTGVLDVEDTNAAVARIKEMGFFPTSVNEDSDKKKVRKGAAAGQKKSGLRNINLSFSIGSSVKGKVLCAFTRQLATLIDAGLPLLRGLRVLEKQEKNPVLKKAIRGISEAVEGGSTFSEAMAQYPKIFNKLYINMVKAGEVAGALETVLNRLAEFMEKAQKIKAKVISAMVYPVVVLGISSIIVTFLLVVIVPKFQQIFNEMLEGEPLPPLTLLMLAISNAIKHHALIVIICIAAFIFLLKSIARSKKGKFAIDAIKLRMPLFGELIRKVSIARFTRTLGTLISSGVPILQALLITRDTSGNEIVAKAVEQVHDAVKEGESIVQPLEASKVFPPMVISMIDVGEETGALPEMLMKIADTYEEEVDNAVGALTSILEPLMIVGLALVIGTIVIALFLPLIAIVNKLGAS
jgi:type IV pilus assembly protein PilC